LTASQLLYDFGATGGAVDAADARAKAAGHEESRDRSSTLVSMLRAVFDLERARRNLFFSRGYVSSRELFLGVTMEREKIGGGSKLDVVRARTKVSEASDEIPAALRDVAAAESRFRELFGGPPPIQKLSYRLPATEVRVDVDTSAVVRQLPAFMNAEAAVLAALGDYEASKGRMWGGLNFEVSNSQSDVGSAAESKQTTAQVVYRVDVFSGFAQSARATAAARYSQAQSERDRVYRELIANAEVSTQSYKAALASRVNRVSLVAGARETDGSTRELFLMGKAPLSDVFRAQEEFFSAVQKLIRAQFDYEVAMVEYLASRGELLPLFDLGI
jgi:adhesin transport system outer membrane protein